VSRGNWHQEKLRGYRQRIATNRLSDKVYKYFAWDKFTNLRAELMMAPV
jgi:hypothetical protein